MSDREQCGALERAVIKNYKRSQVGNAISKEIREQHTSKEVLTVYKRLSKKGRRADALALRAEERRDKLRKALGSCT